VVANIQRLPTETDSGRQIVWQHLERSLQYLQIEALGKRWPLQSLQRRVGSSANLAIRRPDRTVVSAGRRRCP